MKKYEYEKIIEPSLRQARMRRGDNIEFINYALNPKYMNLGEGKFYMLKTYGCQGNLADSERIAGILESLGYVETSVETNADVVIFNTCAIRENAEERVFGEIGRFNRYRKIKKDMIIGVCGCMPQEEHTIEIIKKTYPFINIVFGTHNIQSLPEYLFDAINSNKNIIDVLSIEGNIYEGLPIKRDHPFKAWVNIMYGCDEFCTYCIVPYTRGKERSRHPEDIIEEVKDLIKKGYKEITLLGQNVNAYGKDFKDRNYGFADLLRALHDLPIARIRFTTSHPRDLDDATIEAMALGGNIMPHLHLPVQSGNDRVLKSMNRKYSRGEYLEKIEKLKKAVPGISITTDIIVAFPGETEEEFLDTLSLVKEVKYEGAYTFIYSPREGTPAATYPNPLTLEEKHDRLNRLNDLINEGFYQGRLRFEGQTVDVLVDGPSKNNPDMLCGYTPHNMLVNFKGDSSLIGQIIKIKLIKAYSWHLLGEVEK